MLSSRRLRQLHRINRLVNKGWTVDSLHEEVGLKRSANGMPPPSHSSKANKPRKAGSDYENEDQHIIDLQFAPILLGASKSIMNILL